MSSRWLLMGCSSNCSSGLTNDLEILCHTQLIWRPTQCWMTQLSTLKLAECSMWMVQHLLLGFQTSSAAMDISISPCLLPAVVNDQEARRDIACLQTFKSLLDACSMSGVQTCQWMWPPG